MNPNIRFLAKAARGTAWHSRLAPFDQKIRSMREAGETYEKIAAWIRENGLPITGSAVHAYVSVRARRGSCEYKLAAKPEPQLPSPRDSNSATPLMLSTTKCEQPQNLDTNIEEFVYYPPEIFRNGLHDEDFSINDPLNQNNDL